MSREKIDINKVNEIIKEVAKIIKLKEKNGQTKGTAINNIVSVIEEELEDDNQEN